MIVIILLIVIAVGVFAILAAVFRLAVDVRAIRAELLPDMHATLRRQVGRSASFAIPQLTMSHEPHTNFGLKSGCFAVWEWRDGGWRLASDDLPEGVDPGPPPAYPGAYNGETVKTWIPGKQP